MFEDGRDHAIGYAKTRQGFGQGEIRVLDETGEIVDASPFDDTAKGL